MSLSLNQFLASVEKRAYRMAYIALRHQADALDVVQEAMLKLVQKYSDKSASEWKPLFYSILQSRLLDYHRRQQVRKKILVWVNTDADNDDDSMAQYVAHSYQDSPEHKLRNVQAITQLEKALHALPFRQQQAFLLRHWEGLSVQETARVMDCSEGSVKTHVSRAVQVLREQLEDTWP